MMTYIRKNVSNVIGQPPYNMDFDSRFYVIWHSIMRIVMEYPSKIYGLIP